MAKSVQATVDRWKSGAAGAQTAYTQAVQNTQVDVMGRAVAESAAAVRNFSDAITSGRWARAIQQAGGTAHWKQATVAKAGNYGTGVQQGADKFAASMSKLMPAIEGIVNGLPARQPGNVAANVNNRVLGLAQALHARKGDFKG